MRNLKVIIVDDEKNSRELLQTLLSKYCEGVSVLGMAESVQSGTHLINQNQPDLIFLDIEMPGGDGFNLLENLSEGSFKTCFVTGYKKYALKAIKYGCLDYLLKPVEISDLKHVIVKAKEAIFSQGPKLQESLIVNDGQKISVLKLEEIVTISADSNYSNICLVDKKVLSTDSLSNFSETLDSRFFRTHKSYIINLHFVKELQTGRTMTIHMTNGESVPVAARRKKEFLESLKNIG